MTKSRKDVKNAKPQNQIPCIVIYWFQVKNQSIQEAFVSIPKFMFETFFSV